MLATPLSLKDIKGDIGVETEIWNETNIVQYSILSPNPMEKEGEGDRESPVLKETWKWRIMCESEVWSWAQCSKKTFHHLCDQLKS